MYDNDRGTSSSAADRNTAGSRVATSGVAWASIFAGAAAAAALSLILLILGVGLGFSAVSPWAGEGASPTTFGVSAIVWLTVTQVAAAGLGGYLAGRLRTRWFELHTDEVYFRDTAHGFLAWAIATIVTAAVLTSAIGSIVGGGVKAGASLAGSAATVAVGAAAPLAASAASPTSTGGTGYFIDMLFRPDPSISPVATAATGAIPDNTRNSAEVGRIFVSALSTGTLPAEDAKYIGTLIAAQTNISQADAEKRVADIFTRIQAKAKQAETAAREAADKARKASAYASLWIFVSLLLGAFIASLAATYGGRQRDHF